MNKCSLNPSACLGVSDATVAMATAASGGQAMRGVLTVRGQDQAGCLTSQSQLPQRIQSIHLSTAQEVTLTLKKRETDYMNQLCYKVIQ